MFVVGISHQRMRIKFRSRCPHSFKDCMSQVLNFSRAGYKVCYHYAYLFLGITVFILLVWWNIGDGAECDGTQILERVCEKYERKYLSGNLCHDLCISKELSMESCYVYQNNVKSFVSGPLVFKVSNNLDLLWSQDRIEEGIKSAEFLKQVDELIQNELGHMDTTLVMNQLVLDFDANSDDKIDLGEAQNMWWVLKQPGFLNFYVLQDNTAIPHLNGTCGGISVWYYVHLTKGSTLYTKAAPWPISLFTNKAYRWTLPKWVWRAKVMLSLVELAEELFEKDGVRYHLCNVSGLSLHHQSSYEVVVTEETMLLSSQQIQNMLSNVTCNYAYDCTLTPQCQTTCDFSTRKCSGKVTRPTIAVVCDIMEDYLLFDAPELLKVSLYRLVHRCQSLSLYTQRSDLVHSILILDLKSILWNFIQNKLK